MSWLHWFSGKSNQALLPVRHAQTDSLTTSQQMEFSRPMLGARVPDGMAQPAVTASAQRLEQRRNERNAKRELLFQVVRESMIRVGVLSSAFKFKVLSLDQRGRSFLVMIELSAQFSGEVEKLAEIEAMITHAAKHRFDIMVQAVYWRYFNSNATPASAPAPLLGALQAPISRPAPLFGLQAPVVATAPSPAHAVLQARAAQALMRKTAGMSNAAPIIGSATSYQETVKLEPIMTKPIDSPLSDEEVTAFRRALAAGAAQGAIAATAAPAALLSSVVASKPHHTTSLVNERSVIEQARSKLLLTGYEDTEMADDETMPALSGTQYGELR